MSAEKIGRQLHLLMHLLTSQETVSWENIKTEVRGYQEGSEKALLRKFERDKKELRGAGFEIETCFHHFYGESGGYCLKPSSFSFKLAMLSDEEKKLLFLLCHLFKKPGSFPFAQSLFSSLAKLKFIAGAGAGTAGTNGARADAGLEQVFMAARASHADTQRVSAFLREIHGAVQRQKKIFFLYRTPDGEKVEKRVVHPYVLYCRQGVWYAAGYSEERKGDRIFRLSRMRTLHVNAKKSGQPDYEIPRDFSLQKLLFKETYQVGKGNPVSVRVQFANDMAWLAQRHFAPQGKIRETKRSGKVLSFEVKNVKAFARKLLPYREHVTDAQPQSLRECMKRELLALKEKYVEKEHAAKPA